MDYIQGLAEQTEIFLYSLGFGFLLGILYDIFRTVRMVISNSKSFVFFMDLFYFTVCAFLTFSFVLTVDSGKIRVYVIFGEILGWVIYYFSFGAIALKVSNAVVSFLKGLFLSFLRPLKSLAGRIFRKFAKFEGFCKKNIRKSEKKAKFNLQKCKGIVYNLIGYTEKSFFSKKGNY